MKKTSAIQYSEPFHQMPMSMQVIYHKFFKNNGKEFLKLVKYVRDNDIAYGEVVDAADQIRWNGVRTFTADHFKVALQAMKSGDSQRYGLRIGAGPKRRCDTVRPPAFLES